MAHRGPRCARAPYPLGSGQRRLRGRHLGRRDNRSAVRLGGPAVVHGRPLRRRDVRGSPRCRRPPRGRGRPRRRRDLPPAPRPAIPRARLVAARGKVASQTDPPHAGAGRERLAPSWRDLDPAARAHDSPRRPPRLVLASEPVDRRLRLRDGPPGRVRPPRLTAGRARARGRGLVRDPGLLPPRVDRRAHVRRRRRLLELEPRRPPPRGPRPRHLPQPDLDAGRDSRPRPARAAATVRAGSGRRLGREAHRLREGGAEVVLIQPTADDLALMGSNLMRGHQRAGGPERGRGHGQAVSEERALSAEQRRNGSLAARVERLLPGLAGTIGGALTHAVERRIPTADLDERDPDYIRETLPGLWMLASFYIRADVRGLQRIPAEWPMLLVGNHSGGNLTPDTLVFTLAFSTYFGVERRFFQLAHNLVLAMPGLGSLRKYGTVAASPQNAEKALDTGAALLVYPGGDYEVHRSTWDSAKVGFDGRKGWIRLALRKNVPIVPVVSIGGQETALFLSRGERLARLLRRDRLFRLKVLPISLAIPWGLNIGDMLGHFPLPAKISVRALEPINIREQFGEDPDIDNVYEHLIGAMQAELDVLYRERRLPLIG